MNSEPGRNKSPLPARWWLRPARRLGPVAGWAVLLGGLGVIGLLALFPHRTGPAQPLPFSHHRHAGIRGISCYFCHDSADQSPVAGMPALGKCLLCHDRIVPYFRPISQLHAAYQAGRPINWVRVYRLPDFVHFNHAAHLRRDVDCGQCHGDVKHMDRIVLNERLVMGFCVDCHRRPEYRASVDCWFCHR